MCCLQPVEPRTAAEVVILCCAIKPLCAWNAEDATTTARERCGGQGYLSVNRRVAYRSPCLC